MCEFLLLGYREVAVPGRWAQFDDAERLEVKCVCPDTRFAHDGPGCQCGGVRSWNPGDRASLAIKPDKLGLPLTYRFAPGEELKSGDAVTIKNWHPRRTHFQIEDPFGHGIDRFLLKENVSLRYAKTHTCHCPRENFHFNGIGCTCGGV